MLASPDASAAAGPTSLSVGSSQLEIFFDETRPRDTQSVLTDWIQRSGNIVSHYYGRFPVTHLVIHVRTAPGGGVKTGTTYGMHGGLIRVVVGREATAAELQDDWVLVHEMIHLALPDAGQEHAWLSEGLATYVEGIARAQFGNRTQEDVWAEHMRSMPKGLPQAGDQGLDRTHTWGRTYWGGALFCFVADVQIHQATKGRSGLQEALQAIARTSGGLSTDWPIERIFATGDEATGSKTLQQLYAQWKDRPITPDLNALWRNLGIERSGGTIRLRDDAPLAPIRRDIMRPRASQP